MTIRIAGLLTLIGFASLGPVGSASAVDLHRYQPGPTFGTWQVMCDEEADMGGTTYFDCVVRSTGVPAVIIANLTTLPTALPAGSSTDERLTVSSRTIALAECPDDGCPLEESAEAVVTLMTDHPITVEISGQATVLSAAGLAEAIDLALRRLD